MSKVYTNDGHCLGNEWVNLEGLQLDTKKAIEQLIYLDKTVNALNDQESEHENNTLKIVDSCFKRHAPCFRAVAADMARDLMFKQRGENKMVDFVKEGCVSDMVHCDRFGKGRITYIDSNQIFPVEVTFNVNGTRNVEIYTADGRYSLNDKEPSLRFQKL